MEDQARDFKRQKAQESAIQCPGCKNESGPFNPDFSKPRMIFTCPECSCQFDSDGNRGPFVVVCAQCKQENPFSNEKCYFCSAELGASKAEVLQQTQSVVEQVLCSTCRMMNPKGARRCVGCREDIDGRGYPVAYKN